MRVCKAIAMSSYYREVFHHVTDKDSKGNPVKCRVNGQCKIWKTRPTEFRLPVKYGLKHCFYITQDNCDEWVVTDDWREHFFIKKSRMNGCATIPCDCVWCGMMIDAINAEDKVLQ